MTNKNISHLTPQSFFNKNKKNGKIFEQPLGLDFNEEMYKGPKNVGHTVNATANTTPNGDVSADASYDWTG